MNTDRSEYQTLYQNFVKSAIAHMKDRTLSRTGNTRDPQTQAYLSELDNPDSKAYTEVVERATAAKIIALVSNPQTSPEETKLLKVLQNPHLLEEVPVKDKPVLVEKDKTVPPVIDEQPQQKNEVPHEQEATERPTTDENETDKQVVSEQQAPAVSQNPLPVGDIPQEVMLQVVEQISCSSASRIDIAKAFIEQDPLPDWLQPLADMDTAEATQLLSQRLRVADPGSSKFAYTKYQEHLIACKELIREKLQARLQELITQSIDKHQQIQTELETRTADVKADIETSSEGSTEKRQYIKLWSDLIKQRDDRELTFLRQLQALLTK